MRFYTSQRMNQTGLEGKQEEGRRVCQAEVSGLTFHPHHESLTSGTRSMLKPQFC